MRGRQKGHSACNLSELPIGTMHYGEDRDLLFPCLAIQYAWK